MAVPAHPRRHAALATTLSTVLAAVLLVSLLPMATAAAEVPHVLVFSGTYGFRHDSITKGNEVMQELADETGDFTVEFTELPTDLNADKLRTVDMVLFNSSTGRFPLTAQQRDDMVRYWGCGGGFVGVHAASDANYGWAEWAEIVGAQFDSHPHGANDGETRLIVENADHPVNAAFVGIPDWLHEDEYYRWKRDVRGTQDALPLLSLDETTVREGIQDGATPYVDDQPLAWVKTFRDRGRVYYTNLGHNQVTWDRPEFRQQLVDGITWVGQTTLDTACADGDAPLPPAPAAPPQEPPTEEQPREACVLQEGQQRLTLEGLSYDASHAVAPAYFSRTATDLVLDLSGTDLLDADIRITHEWPNRIDDYDLSVTTPWGFAGSDAVQPLAAAREDALVEDAVHCALVTVDVYNHLAVTGSAGTVMVEVAPADVPPPPDPAPVPPVPSVPASGVVVTPPGGVSTGFLPPQVVLPQGSSLDLVNADTVPHNIICNDRDADRRPVCRSGFASTGGTAAVEGVSALPPGAYDFFCGLHPGMTGTLTIL